MKKIFLFLGLVVIFGSIVIIFLSVNQVKRQEPQEIRSQAAPAASLSLSPGATTYFTSQTFTTNVMVVTGTNQIVSTDLVLTFNPSVLQITGVSAGSFLTNTSDLQKNIDNTNGKVTYSFYTSFANARQGQGILATINFQAKAAGVSTIAFDPMTSIGALNETQNVVMSTSPTTYTVQNDVIPPVQITDLRMTSNTMNSLALAWTAPSDIGLAGKAASYDMRYSTNPISDANWSTTTAVSSLPTPGAPGTTETITVSSLSAGTTYYLAIKSKDANNNISVLSNLLSTTTISRPSLGFQLKFQGITTQKSGSKTITLLLKQGSTTKYTFNPSVSNNTAGLYSATIANIDPGTYDVYIKGWVHLQKKFTNITLSPGLNSQDWSATEMKAGDFDNNNFINAVDIARVIQDYFPSTPANSPADFNLDGTVNAVDIGYLIGNYFQTGDQ
ncbi:MAG: cohesin domain-containing protein [Candidatus Gottesmanbacteria bacterium]